VSKNKYQAVEPVYLQPDHRLNSYTSWFDLRSHETVLAPLAYQVCQDKSAQTAPQRDFEVAELKIADIYKNLSSI
jgi:hypothetical protein